MRNITRLLLSIILILSLFPVFPAYGAEAEPVVKVKLKNYLGDKNTITLVPNGNYSTNIPNVQLVSTHTYTLTLNNQVISIKEGTKELGHASTVSATPETANTSMAINGRPYLGSFEFTIESQSVIRPINTVTMENYLKGVVPFEMPASWAMEALKAQAVTARTYASGHSGQIIDDTINYQVYGGYEWNSRSTEAVDDTKGQMITYNGKSIGSAAFFSSSNGGMTESNANVWGGISLPYLIVKQDPYDPATPWNVNVHKTQIDLTNLDLTQANSWWSTEKETDQTISTNIKNWLKTKGYLNQDIKIISIPSLDLYGKTSGGRVSKGSISIQYAVKDSKGTAILNKLDLNDLSATSIRAMLGISLMKSYLVTGIQTNQDMISISGKGNGHGVGLSQYGAKSAADQGKNYKDILAFYFNGTGVTAMYSNETSPSTNTNSDAAPVITNPVATSPVEKPAVDQDAPIVKVSKITYDSKMKYVKLEYILNEKANMTVYVKDNKGKTISTLLNNSSQQAGVRTVQWNAGKYSNGTYTFVMAAKDGSGNVGTSSVHYNLAKDTTAPTIKGLKVPSPDDTNKVNMTYSTNENAYITITIKDSKGHTIATVEKNRYKKSGKQSQKWDISRLSNGTYSFSISAVDQSNNKRTISTKYTLKKRAAKVVVHSLHVRLKPSTTSKVIGTLKKNKTATTIGKTGSWYEIIYGKSKGYVSSKYVTIK
ncbi:SpoIID/LytB domain-containing protein [Heyndrickxia ginsengihumi]|uniref:SpoIID/LytB domain-containing protein n=1 Tax=Heyndrickxia ginsengihumi TaxID=363870 RepID=UPI000471879A|nr:SpoIID/LytB domain-containing protein [Heyndrickxia ginsengihumi]